jgi:hypothetical protein
LGSCSSSYFLAAVFPTDLGKGSGILTRQIELKLPNDFLWKEITNFYLVEEPSDVLFHFMKTKYMSKALGREADSVMTYNALPNFMKKSRASPMGKVKKLCALKFEV